MRSDSSLNYLFWLEWLSIFYFRKAGGLLFILVSVAERLRTWVLNYRGMYLERGFYTTTVVFSISTTAVTILYKTNQFG